MINILKERKITHLSKDEIDIYFNLDEIMHTWLPTKSLVTNKQPTQLLILSYILRGAM